MSHSNFSKKFQTQKIHKVKELYNRKKSWLWGLAAEKSVRHLSNTCSKFFFNSFHIWNCFKKCHTEKFTHFFLAQTEKWEKSFFFSIKPYMNIAVKFFKCEQRMSFGTANYVPVVYRVKNHFEVNEARGFLWLSRR